MAHFNWGVLRADWDDPAVAPFVAALDAVNTAASESPGFVWRLGDHDMETAQQDMSDIGPPERVASTLSVWTSAETLQAFTYGKMHGTFFGRRAEWFAPQDRPRYVLWDIPAGHRPGLSEAMERRAHLRELGPTDAAFDFGYARSRRSAA
ncbi:MAG: DUF3291 domain-containing protein [Pseudomonadota bacterium]